MIKLLSVLKQLSPEDKKFRQKLKNILGFFPDNIALYRQAFRHSSSVDAGDVHMPSNERLEFLGDTVLGTVVSEYLFKLYPKKDEGFLTQIRSRIVNGQHLYTLSKKFGFDTLLHSNLTSKEKVSSSAYGDVFEAFIGAVFIDKGFEITKKFILQRIIKIHLDMNQLLENDTDYKSQFQILMQRKKKKFEYVTLKEERIGNEKVYTMQLMVDGAPEAEFEHKSKKVAEQKLAQIVLDKLK